MLEVRSLPPADVDASWMRALAEHYERARRRDPDHDLCLVFDIDGTIVDTRHLMVHALVGYDRRHHTDLFRGLVVDDITQHEDDVDGLMRSLDVPHTVLASVTADYRAHLWDEEAVRVATRPFEGVLGVIRWFQLQPRTVVALNTGRFPHMREATLSSLDAIGSAFRVRFDPELLYTRPPGLRVTEAKVAALRALADRGLRVVAVVDNEPENLRAMATADDRGEVLFLHADTIFASQRSSGDRVVAGNRYRLSELVPRRSMPDRVGFVWHGVNDHLNLARFLGSEIDWGEVDLRRDPRHRLVLRHDAFDATPWTREERLLPAVEALGCMVDAGRAVKLDLKEGGETLVAAIDLVRSLGLEHGRLWWNAELPALGEEGFTAVRRLFPDATISCPVDFLVPLLFASDAATERVLDVLRAWGVSRLSIRWGPDVRTVLDMLEARGWEVNIYDVPDLTAFLGASLLSPTSVTADFDFPEWGYGGRGSGAQGAVHLPRP